MTQRESERAYKRGVSQQAGPRIMNVQVGHQPLATEGRSNGRHPLQTLLALVFLYSIPRCVQRIPHPAALGDKGK